MTLIARLERIEFPDGASFTIDMFAGEGEVCDPDVFATLVLITSGNHCVTVFSPRRDERSVPGGWREPGESPLECAVREVAEETNLVLDPASLGACGYEVYTPLRVQGRWPERGGVLRLFRVELEAQLPVQAVLDDAVDPCWTKVSDFRDLAGERFWWPMIEAALAPAPPTNH